MQLCYILYITSHGISQTISHYVYLVYYTVRSIYALLFLETLIREVYGAKEIRTPDPQNANLVLYQLSYNPDTDGPEWT